MRFWIASVVVVVVPLLCIASVGGDEEVPEYVKTIAEKIKNRHERLKSEAKTAKYVDRAAAKRNLKQFEDAAIDLEWYAGQLDLLSPTVGRVGTIPSKATLTVAQIVDDTTMHVIPESSRTIGSRLILRGVSTKGLADGASIGSSLIFLVTGTERYRTVLGSQATCYVLQPIDLEKWIPKIKQLAGLKTK